MEVCGREDNQNDEKENKLLWATQSFYDAASYVDVNCQLMTCAEVIAVTQHSTVHKSYSKVFGRFVAIKIIDKKAMPAQWARKFLPRELEITKRVKHPNIVECFDISQHHPTKVIIISEFCDGNTLLNHVLDKNGLMEKESARLFRQLIDAVHYLHSELSVAHRDIKLENILLDSKGVIKLADFGFAREVYKAEKSTSFCGTRPYCSPQLSELQPYKPFAADWYACGIALFTMISAFWPHQPWENISYPIRYTEKFSNSSAQLIDRLLEKDENLRAGFAECINSDWLKCLTADGSWIVSHQQKNY